MIIEEKKVRDFKHFMRLLRPVLECDGQVLKRNGTLLNINAKAAKWNAFVLDVKAYFANTKGEGLRYRYSSDKKCIQFWEIKQ